MLFSRMSGALPLSSKFRGRPIPTYSIIGKPAETRTQPVVPVTRDEDRRDSEVDCLPGPLSSFVQNESRV
jgi:hypothetical protein